MIFGKDGFVRTRPYGRSRICLKARKYRRFGGFKRNHLWLEWEISDFLDSLSFFDASYSWYDADDYEKGFKRIDAIYKNSDDWNCFFSPVAVTHGYDDVDMLLVNRKTKKFIKTCSESDCVDGKGDMKKLKSDEMKKEIAKLKAAGYRKLKW